MTYHAALMLLLSCLAGRPVCDEAAGAVREVPEMRDMAVLLIEAQKAAPRPK